MRSWISVLPARIREDILINVSKLLIGNFGTVSYRSQHHTYNPLPVFIASSFEILYDVSFNSLNICNDLQWNKGPFTNYVDKILTFLTTCPPFDDIFYLIAVNKNSTFVDYLVPTPLLL